LALFFGLGLNIAILKVIIDDVESIESEVWKTERMVGTEERGGNMTSVNSTSIAPSLLPPPALSSLALRYWRE
jgi:hypothetical protein